MWKLKILLTIFLYFLTLATTSSPCPSECSCQKKSTDCSNKNLAAVPTGISSATKRLLLDNNTLSRISHNAFVNLSNLVELQLSTNKLISLDGFLSSNLVLLQLFNVCSNALTNVSQNALDQLTGLINLDLSHNKISKIHRHAFNKLLKLKVLNLQGNSLTTISLNWFPSSQFPDSLSSFKLNHNPWTCNCEMKDFANISRNLNNSLTSSLHITCMHPGKYSNKPLRKIHLKDLCPLTSEPDSTLSNLGSKNPGSNLPETVLHPHQLTPKVISVAPTKKTKTKAVDSKKSQPPLPTSSTELPHKILILTSLTTVSGSEVTMTCNSSQKTDLTWTLKKRGAKRMVGEDQTRYRKNGNSLTILKAARSDRGSYCCSYSQQRFNCIRLLVTLPAHATSAAVYVIISLVIIALVAFAVFSYRKLKKRRENYGLLADSAVFNPVHDDVTTQGGGYQSGGTTEEYV
ncbi:uncharacterized protein LOC143451562 [Clavelina lepadiformis]|uniref:uncharacterized protein LOC143451562 n=1 Tax=Clavelina lepadiformis TaxID=159417 RepID=UPI004042A70A